MCICVIKPNLMHCLSSVYFVNQTVHVSGIFVAHHQKVYLRNIIITYVYLCNKTQLDALFILSLFRQSNCTCFGHICSPSSEGILYIYIYSNWHVL